MKKSFILLLTTGILLSCGPSQRDYDTLSLKNKELEQEIATLKLEADSLKTEILNYQNTPDKLYEEANVAIKNKDITELTNICKRLEKYHPTSTECKKTQASLQKLIDKRDADIKAEKAKRMTAVKKLKKEYDDISGITWYYNPYFTHYNNDNKTSLYIGQNNSKIWLRLKMSYEGDDWIFFDNAYLSFDGETKEIFFNKYRDKETDNGYGGRVWEWIDVSVNDELLVFLKNMVKGNTLKIRLSGKYTDTRNITGNEKKALEDILLAYDVLINENK